ncbi:hypothetical protein AY599_10115 [Leptolyngbya valderiana BDU 20041]|nr:hypothetical protein AY599_10115 [Leptolyngbya valderiana BDU 20041]
MDRKSEKIGTFSVGGCLRRAGGGAFGLGACRAAGLLGPAVFLAMFGYGAYAQGMGLDLWLAVGACLLLWGLPQQIAFTELAVAGAAPTLAFLTVALVAGRSLFLNLACTPLIRGPGRRFPPSLWLFAQFISPSNWAHMRLYRSSLTPEAVPRYFAGLLLGMLVFSLAGVLVGHGLGDLLPPALAPSVALVPGLYVLLLVLAVPQAGALTAGALGAALVPLAVQAAGDLGLALGGMAAGTAAFGIAEARRRHA